MHVEMTIVFRRESKTQPGDGSRRVVRQLDQPHSIGFRERGLGMPTRCLS